MPENRPNILKDKSFAFAIRIVKLYKYLKEEQREPVLSKQVYRSGTAIGALIREAQYAQSKKDFINKLSIAIKEANETMYWLELLFATDFIEQQAFVSMKSNCEELIKMLTSSINTSKGNNN